MNNKPLAARLMLGPATIFMASLSPVKSDKACHAYFFFSTFARRQRKCLKVKRVGKFTLVRMTRSVETVFATFVVRISSVVCGSRKYEADAGTTFSCVSLRVLEGVD